MQYKAPKGTKDIQPAQSHLWHSIENTMRAVTRNYGYREVRTPVFESTELFLRGVGDTTDIVQKEMYTFLDKGNRSMTLKPEGTAGVVRQFVEHGGASEAQPVKMYYLNCPVFRYENTQAGRLREHHQFGVELFGAPQPSADAEVMSLAAAVLQKLGVTSLDLRINNIGCPACRPKYNQALREYFSEHLDDMCTDCRGRFEHNPLRMLDCKKEGCREFTGKAPVMIDYACEDCAAHFDELQGLLGVLKIAHTVDPYIVRGLDYYTKTVFEFVSTHAGSQGTVCGGGRYDRLIEELGGSSIPGVGFGMGMERLLMVLDAQGQLPKAPRLFDIYVASMGEPAKKAAMALVQDLRGRGVKAECDHVGRSLKAQLKYADKIQAAHVLVLGESELNSGVANCKDMDSGAGQEMRLEGFADAYAKRMSCVSDGA